MTKQNKKVVARTYFGDKEIDFIRAKEVSPFRYQFTIQELATELDVSTDTIRRRKSWAQEHYNDWRKAFLYGGLIDIREWQKVIAAYSAYQYKAHEDPHLRILEGGSQ